jgi:CCAAT/enhancer binding protein (C/EBP) gamma
MPTNKIPIGSKKEPTKEDPQYKEKRIKNNDAVKKSRQKSKTNNKVTLEKVTEMKCENEVLEARIKLVGKELQFLIDIYLSHVKGDHSLPPPQCLDDIKKVL